MARIRTIKPEFPHSESMGNVTRDARLTFVLMWTIADDSGRLRGNSRMLASLLFPYDDDAPKKIDSWLAELQQQNCIQRYESDNAQYIQIQNWLSHQRIDRPSESKIPPFDESSRIIASDTRALDLARARLGSKDQGEEGTKDQDQRKRHRSRLTLDDLSIDHNAEWLAKKRAEGRYINHDEAFILDQFKQYCRSHGKQYADYLEAYRNAFEWEKCQPKQSRKPKEIRSNVRVIGVPNDAR